MNPNSATDHLSLLSEPIGPIDDNDIISLDLQAIENTVQQHPSYLEEMKDTNDNNDGEANVWNEWDVPIGRGRVVREFVGNERYRDLIEQFRPMYLRVKKRKEKREVSVTIFNTIKSNGGRFLAPCGSRNESWREISKEKALAKIGQALRNGVRPPQPLHSSWTYPVDGETRRGALTLEAPRPLFVNMPLTRSLSAGFVSASAEIGDSVSNLSFTSDNQHVVSHFPWTDFDSNTNQEWNSSSSLEPNTFM
eukprot:scaffold976_cov161-Amphora_coffeaeformis.AAC.1